MRQLNKYKKYTQIDLIAKFPLRILKFKRPKWQRTKDTFLNNTTLGKELFDITSIKNDFKNWSKVSQAYSERLENYSFLSTSLNNSINLKKVKKTGNIKLRKNLYSKLYFENYYKVCTLTWFANFFSSSFEAKQKIHGKKVLVNNSIATSNSLLNRGDILSLKDDTINLETVYKKYNKTLSILTHVEIDYYTQDIIVLKNLSDLSEEDYFLLCSDYINLQSLR